MMLDLEAVKLKDQLAAAHKPLIVGASVGTLAAQEC
jgi:hypothetical protein